jgi:hypothetical protein
MLPTVTAVVVEEKQKKFPMIHVTESQCLVCSPKKNLQMNQKLKINKSNKNFV